MNKLRHVNKHGKKVCFFLVCLAGYVPGLVEDKHGLYGIYGI